MPDERNISLSCCRGISTTKIHQVMETDRDFGWIVIVSSVVSVPCGRVTVTAIENHHKPQQSGSMSQPISVWFDCHSRQWSDETFPAGCGFFINVLRADAKRPLGKGCFS